MTALHDARTDEEKNTPRNAARRRDEHVSDIARNI